jgi:hypothetical protein
VGVGWSLAAVSFLLVVCMGIVAWMVRTGYRLKN